MQIAQTLDRGLKLFNVQRSCVYDGPGVRTTIFCQGCNLRCSWCQNPEGQSCKGDKGEIYSVEDILEIISKDKDYFSSTNGGVTLSGGEPFLQDTKNLTQFLEEVHDLGLHVAIETALHVPWENISDVAKYIDLFLVDLKIVGDDDLHKKYTKQGSKLIHSNITRLLDLGANVKFRMVMVPGFTDTEQNVKATSEFLKSIGYDAIELLKFHNIYEDKVERLSLDAPQLDITPEQSLSSLKDGINLFQKYGITPEVETTALEPISSKTQFTPRVRQIQKDIKKSGRALCMESSLLKTKYYKKHGFKKPTPIHRAERLSYVLDNKKIIIYPEEMLVGNFTSKRVAGQVWEEHHGTVAWTFVHKIHRQTPIPFKVSFKEQMDFYLKILPFWNNRNVIGKMYPTLPSFILGISRLADVKSGFNNDTAAIAHFIVNFERILQLGTSGIIEEIETAKKERPNHNQDFYDGTIIALKALERYGIRYAKYLSELSKKEKNQERRNELEQMAEVCNRVPKYPARTFHEALQSMLFLHIALCMESYENAVSFGRMDQYLYPYYKRDLDAGRITYEEAKELLCLFVLKMDELVLVNDGDSIFKLYRLFETPSTDQAATFGGVDRNGDDATNDVTYMMLDACELQPLAMDMAARVHEGSPDKYVERIAEIYIKGCPVPQVFADNIYIDSILKHYPTAIEDARNYSIVGCVEPNASDDHFGNTDCANLNLAQPFLQALKGHEHDLWDLSPRELLSNLVMKIIRSTFTGINRISRFVNRILDKLVTRRDIKKGLYQYDPASNMDELLGRFQERLNILAKSVLRDHQAIERVLSKDFTTPLTSSLFKGCIKRGKDVYEGGADFNSSGIQAVGVTDVADSLHAINEVVFKQKLYSINDVILAIDSNFKGRRNQQIRQALLSVPKFGNDNSPESTGWVTKVMGIFNNALDSVPHHTRRNARYSAGYYALNIGTQYGINTQALPSGRKAGVPLANSIIPHYGMKQSNLFSTLNSVSGVDFVEHAENGATATLTIDSALFQGRGGAKKLGAIIKTFLTKGGMQLQPNVLNREMLLDAYVHPEKYPDLLVRIAGYCAYFNELSDQMKKVIINRSCYS